jgi:glutamate 5-kinase
VDGVEIPSFVWEAAGGSLTGMGTGGMLTKVRAADVARRMGTPVMIANGTIPDVLLRIAAGERFGTVFRATNTVLESRKRYLLTGFRSNEACDYFRYRAPPRLSNAEKACFRGEFSAFKVNLTEEIR